jgi:hypothetical protein
MRRTRRAFLFTVLLVSAIVPGCSCNSCSCNSCNDSGNGCSLGAPPSCDFQGPGCLLFCADDGSFGLDAHFHPDSMNFDSTLDLGIPDTGPATGTCNALPCSAGCTCALPVGEDAGTPDAGDANASDAAGDAEPSVDGGGMTGVCTCPETADAGADAADGDAALDSAEMEASDAPFDSPLDAPTDGNVDGAPPDAAPDVSDAGDASAVKPCGVIFCEEPCACLNEKLSECWCP